MGTAPGLRRLRASRAPPDDKGKVQICPTMRMVCSTTSPCGSKQSRSPTQGGIAMRVEAIGPTKARHADLLGALSTVELAVLLTTLTDPADRQRMVYDFNRRF